MSDSRVGVDVQAPHELACAGARTRATRRRFFSGLAACLVCATLFVSFRIGLDRRFADTVGPGVWGRIVFAVGAAVTQMEHGGYGYTISEVIETVLTQAGLTGDDRVLARLGTHFPDNLANPTLINAAIDKAVHFKWRFDPNEKVRGSGGDDLGLVDYARFSFHLFGYKLLSLYLAYFVIWAISASAFIYAFRARPGLLTLLVVASVAQIFVFTSTIFDSHNLGSVADPRFLSILAIIPGMHLAFLIIGRSPPILINIALAIVQSVIVVFAVWTRSTALWVIVAVALLTIAVVARTILARRFELRQIWSFAVLLAVWIVHAVWTSMALHPVYKEKDDISHHVVWHGIFYQLQHHPQWKQKYAAEYDYTEWDDLPPTAAKKYLARHPPREPEKVYLTSDHKYLRVAASESYVMKGFFEFFAKDPRFVLETYFVYVPKKLFYILGPMAVPAGRPGFLGIMPTYQPFGPSGPRTEYSWYVGLLRNLNRHSAVDFAMLGLAFVLLAGFLAIEDVERRVFTHGTILLTVAFVISLLPILPAPDYATVADQYFVLLIVLGSWGIFLLCAALRLCLRLVLLTRRAEIPS